VEYERGDGGVVAFDKDFERHLIQVRCFAAMTHSPGHEGLVSLAENLRRMPEEIPD
jgi:hypothetical protein